MRQAILSSTKYDGSLHYRYETSVVSESANEIRLYVPPGRAMTTYRGELHTKSHCLQIFYTDRNWNVVVRWRADWRFEEHYVNIARPAEWDGRVLNWIDMDLDLILHANAEEPTLDDEDEFERHRVKWSYPQNVVDESWSAVEEVWSLLKSRTSPFDDGLQAWRPDASSHALSQRS